MLGLGPNSEKRRRTFADPALQAEFERIGWVVVPFLAPEVAQELRSVLEGYLPADPPPMFSPHRGDTIADRIAMNDVVAAHLNTPALELMPDHRPLVAGMVAKRPGPDSDLPLHRDWNYVDESRFTSALVWVGLEDITSDNGGLYAVAGSHRLAQTYRGSGPGEWPQAEDAIRGDLTARYLTHIEVPIGHACIFDNSVLHGSLPNTTDRTRIVAAVTFIPSEAEVVHYYVDADQRRYRYTLDPDFLLRVHELDKVFEGDHVLGVDAIEPTLPRFGADELAVLVPSSGSAKASGEAGSARPPLQRRGRRFALGALRRSRHRVRSFNRVEEPPSPT
jgi:hypothetical protein